MSKKNSCVQIEAIVSFDDRGQLVIPKELRKKFQLKAGDKFALISCMTNGDDGGCCTPSDSALCCFTLVHTDQLKGMVTQAIGPMMSEIFNQ